MACATMSAVSSSAVVSATRRSPVTARRPICVPARLGKPAGLHLQSGNPRSLAAAAVYGSCWGPTVVGCGPSVAWRRGSGQRSFEKWAEQASNNMWFPVDVEETVDEYTFVADVPGLGKNDIKVQVNKDRVLSISGQRQQRSSSGGASTSGNKVEVEDASSSASDKTSDKTSDRKVQRRRQERRFGTFRRTWNLPEDADVSQIRASVEQGVLTLQINRIQPAEPEVTDIPIN